MIYHIKSCTKINHHNSYHVVLVNFFSPLIIHLYESCCSAVIMATAMVDGVEKTMSVQVVHQLVEYNSFKYLAEYG